MNTAERLIAAKALIDEEYKWTKGRAMQVYESFNSYCSLGAIRAAVDDEKNILNVYEVVDAMLACFDLPKHPIYNSQEDKLVVFNDQGETTHAEVMALFDKAIENAKVKEG